jgi:hypothetical protein
MKYPMRNGNGRGTGYSFYKPKDENLFLTGNSEHFNHIFHDFGFVSQFEALYRLYRLNSQNNFSGSSFNFSSLKVYHR